MNEENGNKNVEANGQKQNKRILKEKEKELEKKSGTDTEGYYVFRTKDIIKQRFDPFVV